MECDHEKVALQDVSAYRRDALTISGSVWQRFERLPPVGIDLQAHFIYGKRSCSKYFGQSDV